MLAEIAITQRSLRGGYLYDRWPENLNLDVGALKSKLQLCVELNQPSMKWTKQPVPGGMPARSAEHAAAVLSKLEVN